MLEHIDKLHYSFQEIKKRYPFIIDGIVILPEHLHMMITLPPNDAKYSLRIRLIKSLFSYQINSRELISSSRKHKKDQCKYCEINLQWQNITNFAIICYI